MKVRVRLFAVARQLAGQEIVELETPAECTVGLLRERLAQGYPALKDVLPHVLFAIGTNYANDQTVLTPDSEVACIPPVSGG